MYKYAVIEDLLRLNITKMEGNIVLIGISNISFMQRLQDHGYTIIAIDTIDNSEATIPKCDLFIIAASMFQRLKEYSWERLYTLSGNAPVTVFLDTCKESTGNFKEIIARYPQGMLEFVYDFEIESKYFIQRIHSIITQKKNHRLLEAFTRQIESYKQLENELNFRDKLLNHEQIVNANLIESITSGLFICDCEGTLLLINEQARLLLNIHTTDILGSSFKQVFPEILHGFIEEFMKQTPQNEHKATMKKIRIGTYFLELVCYFMRGDQSQKKGILFLINDITELEQHNQLLYRTEKLATIGTMLSGVAHELRNPLAIISAWVQKGLSSATPKPEWLSQCFPVIFKQTNRCASIVNTLLDFSRSSATRLENHPAGDILDEALSYLKYQSDPQGITITKEYLPECTVYGDRSRFVQLFLNLITNAVDAMDDKGILTLSMTKPDEFSVVIKVRDTGHGIPKEIENKIFDPFFTTKEVGKGTGLGLAVTYKIVQESNGRIWFTSSKDGTLFFVQLPVRKEILCNGSHPSGG